MLTVEDVITRSPVIPVITIEKLDDCVPLATALLAGGLAVLELTMRTPVALDAIKLLRKKFPSAIVGAGTVMDAAQLQQAIDAGAQFIVSPGTTDKLVSAVAASGLAYLPGAATPSEMMRLAEQGFNVQKFFPAEAAGGVDMLRSLAAPLAKIRFCPTGGLTPDNAMHYLGLPNVVCIGGSWMVSKKLVDGHQWKEIERLSHLAAALPRSH